MEWYGRKLKNTLRYRGAAPQNPRSRKIRDESRSSECRRTTGQPGLSGDKRVRVPQSSEIVSTRSKVPKTV